MWHCENIDIIRCSFGQELEYMYMYSTVQYSKYTVKLLEDNVAPQEPRNHTTRDSTDMDLKFTECLESQEYWQLTISWFSNLQCTVFGKEPSISQESWNDQ